MGGRLGNEGGVCGECRGEWGEYWIYMCVYNCNSQSDFCAQNLVLVGELQRKKKSEWDSYNDEQKKEVEFRTLS